MRIKILSEFISEHNLQYKESCSSGHTVNIMENPKQGEKFAVKTIYHLKEAIGEMIAYNLLEKLGVEVPKTRLIAKDSTYYYLITNFVGLDIKDCLRAVSVAKEDSRLTKKGYIFDGAFSEIQNGHIQTESSGYKKIIGLREHLMAFVMTGDQAILSSNLSNGRLIDNTEHFLFCKIDPYNDTDIFMQHTSFTSLINDLTTNSLKTKERQCYRKGFGFEVNRGCYPLFPFSTLDNETIITSAKKVCALTENDIRKIVEDAFPDDVDDDAEIDEIPKETLKNAAINVLLERQKAIASYLQDLYKLISYSTKTNFWNQNYSANNVSIKSQPQETKKVTSGSMRCAL